MMKKIKACIFVCMLMLSIGVSYSVAAIRLNNNFQFDDEKISTHVDTPLTIRAEVTRIEDRKVVLNVYATNTWDEQIIVDWGFSRCSSIVWYLPTGEPDSRLMVYMPYRRNILHILGRINTKFGPGQEKLLQTTAFFGLSNLILPLGAYYKDKIESFPWLPDGEYRFDASINPYRLAGDWYQYVDTSKDSVFFHFGP